jgi:hypothetical protein
MPGMEDTPLRPLRRVPSLVLNSPRPIGSEARKDNGVNKPHGGRKLKAADSRDYEVIPDSEEEKLK